MLGVDGELAFEQGDGGLKVQVPKKVPDDLAVVLKIEGLKIQGFQPDLSIRFRDGKAVLGAQKAVLTGPKLAVESKVAGQPNLGFWDDPTATASWEVKFPAAGTYEVRGRFAATRQGTFKLKVGKAELTAQPPATGAWDKFETAQLGTVEVKEAGAQQVKVVPVADGWAAMNLAWIELKQAK